MSSKRIQENTYYYLFMHLFLLFLYLLVCLDSKQHHERESGTSIQEGVGIHPHSGLFPQGGRWWPGTARGEQLHRSHLAHCRSQIWQDEGTMRSLLLW